MTDAVAAGVPTAVVCQPEAAKAAGDSDSDDSDLAAEADECYLPQEVVPHQGFLHPADAYCLHLRADSLPRASRLPTVHRLAPDASEEPAELPHKRWRTQTKPTS